MAIVHTPGTDWQIAAVAELQWLHEGLLIGSDSRFEFSKGAWLGRSGFHYGEYVHDHWETNLGACKRILFRRDVLIHLESSLGRERELGSFRHVILLGNSLWLPDEHLAAWYREDLHQWSDARNDIWERLVLTIG